MYNSDPENYRPIEVPETALIVRTTHKVLREFAVFFEELRDSLRNVELEIGKYLAEKNLLKSEAFWRDFINKARTPGRIESPLWDFKESLEMWHAPGSMRQKQQIEFSKLVAAFANSAGGADKTRDVVGVPDLESRVKSVSEAVRRWIDYPRKDQVVDLQPVVFDQGRQPLACLVVAIAQTEGIMAVRGEWGEYYYPDRVQIGVAYPTCEISRLGRRT